MFREIISKDIFFCTLGILGIFVFSLISCIGPSSSSWVVVGPIDQCCSASRAKCVLLLSWSGCFGRKQNFLAFSMLDAPTPTR